MVTMKAINSTLFRAGLLLTATAAAVLLILFLNTTGVSRAQVAPPPILGLEGPVTGFDCTDLAGDPADDVVLMSVMGGAIVRMDRDTDITSPTAELTLEDACNTASLQGRGAREGFLESTTITTGTIDVNDPADGSDDVLIGEDVFFEPNEGVLIGVVTGVGPDLAINEVPLVELTDSRIPADPPTNDFGFEIDPDTLSDSALIGNSAAAEGYYGDNGTPTTTFSSGPSPGVTDDAFYWFLVEVTGADPANPDPEVNITRAQCQEEEDEGIELRVQGNTHPDSGTVTISNTNDPNEVFGTASVVAALNPPPQVPHGSYTFRLRNDDDFLNCPDSVRATFQSATFDVEPEDR